jgi:hypothetical protein
LLRLRPDVQHERCRCRRYQYFLCHYHVANWSISLCHDDQPQPVAWTGITDVIRGRDRAGWYM